MNSAAHDFTKIAAGRALLYDDLEWPLVKYDPATGPGEARIEVHSTSSPSAANAVFDPGSCLFVGFSNPAVRQTGAAIGVQTIILPGSVVVHQVSAPISVQAVVLPGTMLHGMFHDFVRGLGSAGLVGFRDPTTELAGGGGAASSQVVSRASGIAKGPLSSLSRCLSMLRARRMLLSNAQADALERQLVALLHEEDELKDAGISVSEPSLHRLIDFLSSHKTLAHPNLSITQIGHFAASWSPRKRAKLTIIFNPRGSSEWVAIDLDATPPVHDKGVLANLLDKFAMWMRA